MAQFSDPVATHLRTNEVEVPASPGGIAIQCIVYLTLQFSGPDFLDKEKLAKAQGCWEGGGVATSQWDTCITKELRVLYKLEFVLCSVKS